MSVREIQLHDVLPAVFCGMESEERIAESQVWLRNVRFERGCRTLIAAESGTGKSSLLSFIFGRRRDYMGEIYFDGVNVRGFTLDRWCSLRSQSLSLLPQSCELHLSSPLPYLDGFFSLKFKRERNGSSLAELSFVGLVK